MTLAEQILTDFNTGDAMADSAIFGKVFTYKEIPLDLLDPHPDNRALDEKQIKDLTKDIERNGLGQAILVREKEDGRYQIIAGEHRFEAFKLLYAWSGDEKYSVIPCTVKNLDDETATRLLWSTNLHSKSLTQVERGRAYEVLGYTADKLREENPDAFKGVRTNEIIAGLASDAEHSVSEATVKRARKAYKDSLKSEEELAEEEAQEIDREGDNALKALEKAVERVEIAVGMGTINPARLRPVAKKLRSLARVG